MYQLDLKNRADKELVPGGRTRTFWGDKMLVSRFTLAPAVVVP